MDRLSKHILRKDRHELRLNGSVIDVSHSATLAQSVWSNFSGEAHLVGNNPHYKQGNMGSLEWVAFQEQRLKVKLSGLLELVEAYTGRVVVSCSLLSVGVNNG